MLWTDTTDIAEGLFDTHPDINPERILFTDLRTKILALPHFSDDPERSGEKILEAVQMQWIELYHDSL